MKTRIDIDDALLLLLDKSGDDAIQTAVDAAKFRLSMQQRVDNLPPPAIDFIANVVRRAAATGELQYHYADLRKCDLCCKWAGYAKHKRTTHRHRKGDDDRSKPLYLHGVDLAKGFVVTIGYPTLGCCLECFTAIKPVLAEMLVDVRAEVSERITDHPPHFKKFDNKTCTLCGWTGHEGEMRLLDTLMGRGKYRGGCPACPAENGLLATPVKSREGFVVLEALEPAA